MLKERAETGDTRTPSCRPSAWWVLFLGIAGALGEDVSRSPGGTVASSGSMLAVVSLVLGAVTGEFLDIERRLEQFGDWLRVRLHSERDPMFVEGFVTTSLTICVGAMAVVGALEDGIGGDPSMLFTKAILDCVIVMVFAAGYGKGPSAPSSLWPCSRGR